MCTKKHSLCEIFIEALNAYMPHSMREYWGSKNNRNLHDLTFQAKSLLQLQGHDVTNKRTRPAGPKPRKQRGKTWPSQETDVNAARSKST